MKKIVASSILALTCVTLLSSTGMAKLTRTNTPTPDAVTIQGKAMIHNLETGKNDERFVKAQYTYGGAFIRHLDPTLNTDPNAEPNLNNSHSAQLSPDGLLLRYTDATGTDTRKIHLDTVSGNIYATGKVISVGVNAGDEKVTGVKNGEITDASHDAVNGSQLYGVMDKLGVELELDNDNAVTGVRIKDNSLLSGTVGAIDGKVTALGNKLSSDISAVGANAAAMTALRPLPLSANTKWSLSVGLGH